MTSSPGFARNLSMLLGVHNLDAGEFAGRCGISTTSVSYWLNGHREPSADHLIAIADFFSVDPRALLRAEPTEFIREVGNPDRFAAVEHEIFWQGRDDAPTPIRRAE